MRTQLLGIALVFCVASVATPALAQPETRGSFAFTTWDAGRVTLDTASIPVTVYYPTDPGGPFPVLAVVHGAGRTGAYMAEMARTLASRGFVALVPSIPCTPISCDHAANARQIRALLEWGVAQSAGTSAPIAGLVDGERRGVIGHSWGGLAVFLAAQGHPEIDAVVTLDPNDDSGIAAAAAPTMTQPSAHLMAQVMGACNATNWKDTVFPSTPSPHMRLVVTGAGHCDVEDPTDALCAFACTAGGGITLAPVFRRYAVAFMGCMLQSDTAMAPYVGGSALDADTTSDVVRYVSTDGLDLLPCNGGTLPDAGVTPADAGVVDTDAGSATGDDAATDVDAATADDAGTLASDAGLGGGFDGGTAGPESTGGCGCRATGARAPGAWLAALALASMLISSRARRRST